MFAVVLRFKRMLSQVLLVLTLMIPAIGFTQGLQTFTSVGECDDNNTDYMCISASPGAGETVSIRLFNEVKNVNIDWDDGDRIASEKVCSTITAKDQDGNNISGTITDGQSYITGISNSPASKDYADTDAVILSCTYNTGGSYTIALGGSFLGYGWRTTPASGVSAITGVSHWGNTDVQSLAGAFRSHVSLTDIPDNLPTSVTSLGLMFYQASSFNSANVRQWDTTNIENMINMFNAASAFNQDIGQWDTSNVISMGNMFKNSAMFNQDLSQWDVSRVRNMSSMFDGATGFNQDIGGWDTSAVTGMSSMFESATAFNQDISQWDISSVTDMDDMFNSAELSVNNYDALITRWNTQLGDSNSLQSLNFNGGTSKFCEAAVSGTGQDPSYSTENSNTVYDCSPRIIRVTLDDPPSGSSTLTLTVTFSEPVFTTTYTDASGSIGVGTLEVGDFNVTISDSGTVVTPTINSISQNGNSYTLGVTITGTLQEDQIITVLPVTGSIFDANGNRASHN